MSAIPALTLAEVNEQAITPALILLPPMMDSPRARCLVLAIGAQESEYRDRRQLILVKRDGRTQLVAEGPAKSFWMGERGGGLVHYARTHPASAPYAKILYAARKVKPQDNAIWNAIEHDDVLAAGLARLLIFTDPYRLPDVGAEESAWDLYMRLWRPGKPRRAAWEENYGRAAEFIAAGAGAG